jgi:hypothetical protein
MSDTINVLDPANWVCKLQILATKDLNISIKWDPLDPDLDYWNCLGDEGRKEFILTGLYKAFETLGITTNDT